MASYLREFYNALTAEEQKFTPYFRSDNLGIILRCAINELDWFQYNLSKEKNHPYERYEQFNLLQFGVCRVIQLALDARDSFDVPVVMFPRRKEVTCRTLEIVSALGIIEHGRRVAQTVALGAAKIEKVNAKSFIISLPSTLIDEEYLDRAIVENYNADAEMRFSEILQKKEMADLESEVNSMLSDLVYPFEKHYIGYGASPLLDDYFFGLAYHKIQLQEGYDTFHYRVEFGGIRFQSYILATTFLMSIGIRHERFAEALVAKDNSIKLENILTISSDAVGLVESIRDAVNSFGSVYDDFKKIDYKDALTIYKILSVSRSSTKLLSAPGSPLPILIQPSEKGVIRCLTGVHSEPIRFLLESLRHNFAEDYDKNQQTREQSMQRAVKRVFNEFFQGLEYRENILIRSSGKILTDIDLVVLDEKSETVLLIQLKHQDPYGQNLHARRIRAERLQEQVADWLQSVESWVSSIGEIELRSSLRIQKSFPIPKIRRLIVSRHFSYPLRSICERDDTAFASWPQFINTIALLKKEDADASVDAIIPLLQKIQFHTILPEYLPEPETRWTINELEFTIRQSIADSAEDGI